MSTRYKDINPIVDTLYGTHAHASRVCAYCKRHRAGVTVTQLKRKDCLKKQCNALYKYAEHPYWTQREVIKQRKKENKLSGKEVS